MARRDAGAAGLGWIVFAAVAFGLYTGWCFLTVPMTKGTIERTVNYVLDGVSHDATDESIRAKIIRRASSVEIDLYDDDIWVDRESHEGERIIHIGVDYPVTLDYLGGERTVDTSLDVTRVFRVNEAELVRRARVHEQRMERNNEAMEIAGRWTEKVAGELEKCKEATGSRCRYSVTGAGQVDPDDVKIQRFYDSAPRD